MVEYDVVMVAMLYSSAVSFFFLMIRRPPRSTLDRSSAASDVYKRQEQHRAADRAQPIVRHLDRLRQHLPRPVAGLALGAVSYTHLRAHETVLDLVCRLLLEKKKEQIRNTIYSYY